MSTIDVSALASASQDLHAKKTAHSDALAAYVTATQPLGLSPPARRPPPALPGHPVPAPPAPASGTPDFNALVRAVTTAKAAMDASQAAYDAALSAHQAALDGAGVNRNP